MKRVLWVLILAGCGKSSPPPLPAPQLPFLELGAFEHKEKAPLPEIATKWHGKLVRATGFINPGLQVRNLSRFYLVKDRSACCFGRQPQINHYLDVVLKKGATTDYSPDPVTVQGVLLVEERFDGDWPTGLYWMENAEVVK
jgi:hypothetical protein